MNLINESMNPINVQFLPPFLPHSTGACSALICYFTRGVQIVSREPNLTTPTILHFPLINEKWTGCIRETCNQFGLALFRGYLGPTTFSNCEAPTWFLSASYRRPPTTAACPSLALGEHFLRSAIGLSSSIWRSKRQSLDERHLEFVLRTDRSMNGRSLDANFAVKLCVRAVCEGRPLRTPAFIWKPARISYTAVKPPAFKRGPAFIQIRRLFEELR